ncbi:LADA_0H15236g1_1 [Lachancea dasiensis]|uniref:LADA_0H15236g1_1 n=1 Tax=Lachancea dasiensis TaxID=1072105 RepID=A0A1G4K4R5_9SACH|nr:LADA_0H15236g1_1 [Lachancea dasiensis]
MSDPTLSLEDAQRLILSLERQLEELGSTSHEYELELEGVIKNLESQLNEKDEMLGAAKASKNLREQVTTLEIRTDELESENRTLRHQLRQMEIENGNILEQNILLQHELSDFQDSLKGRDHLANGTFSQTLPKIVSENARIKEPQVMSVTPPKRAENQNVLKVSSDHSSLRLSSLETNTDRVTFVSNKSVVSTTGFK